MDEFVQFDLLLEFTKLAVTFTEIALFFVSLVSQAWKIYKCFDCSLFSDTCEKLETWRYTYFVMSVKQFTLHTNDMVIWALQK